MCEHLLGMDPGISPSGPHYLDSFTEQGGKGLFQYLLHCNGIGLILPAVVRLSEIRKLDKISQWDPLLLSL